MTYLFPEPSMESNILITCQKTNANALDFPSLKEVMDDSYNSELVKQTFSTTFNTEDITINDFITGEYKTKNGSAFKASYSLTIPKDVQLGDMKTTEPIILKQTVYTIYIDDYSINIVSSDMNNMELEPISDYIIETFTLR